VRVEIRIGKRVLRFAQDDKVFQGGKVFSGCAVKAGQEIEKRVLRFAQDDKVFVWMTKFSSA